MNDQKEVCFATYCPQCKYWEKDSSEEPCWRCEEQGWNIDSHKPIKFVPNKDKGYN